MNAQGVSIERGMHRPILSSLHAAFSFGGFAGAGPRSAWPPRSGVAPLPHFAFAAVLFGVPGLVATSRLPLEDHDADSQAPKLRWTRIPGRLALLGVACFFSLMAEGGASDWSAKLVRDDLAGNGRVRGDRLCGVQHRHGRGPAAHGPTLGPLGSRRPPAAQRRARRGGLCRRPRHRHGSERGRRVRRARHRAGRGHPDAVPRRRRSSGRVRPGRRWPPSARWATWASWPGRRSSAPSRSSARCGWPAACSCSRG